MSGLEEIDLIEPRTIDEARLQMVRSLHDAMFGDVWARPESPLEVWRDLLGRVETMRRAIQPPAPSREPWTRIVGWQRGTS